MDFLVSIPVGIFSAIVAVFLLQGWPHGYSWAKDISWTEGEPSGHPIYQVKLERRKHRVFKALRRGPMDVQFHARVATKGIGYRPKLEKIVAIPVDKDWRPVVAKSVLVKLLVGQCEERHLRYFPDAVRSKRRAGTLTLEDLLKVGESELRVYVFAYRRRAGSRWMARAKYGPDAIKPGLYEGLRVVVPEDGRPPRRPDLDETAETSRHEIRIGRWRAVVSRER